MIGKVDPGVGIAGLVGAGRTELLRCVFGLDDVRAGRLDPDSVDEETLRRYLYDPETPDPDLLIRTGGELRLSNFLLWQASYAELYVTDQCWPDFREDQLLEALRDYAGRRRRYGGLLPDETDQAVSPQEAS